MRKNIILSGVLIILTIGAIATRIGDFSAETNVIADDIEKKPYEYHYSDSEIGGKAVQMNDTQTPAAEKQYIEADTNPESYTVLVNREHLLPKEYIPADLVVPDISFSYTGIYEKSYMRRTAALALEELFAAALKENYKLYGVSAYRSYERQEQIYKNNVRKKGEEKANQVSALPGSSEHQTGLAIDVSCSSVNCDLEESFGRTEEGKWLKKNCHKYGFIIRYPHWRERVTGYTYEPWHIRYVGKNLAKYLYQKKLTLEEYYQQTTVDEKVESDPISDIDDIQIENEPEMTTAPTPMVTEAPVTAAPRSSDSRTQTAAPKQTKAPKKTKEPEKSDDSEDETTDPEETAAPEMTKKPAETEKPVVTKKPAVTEEPATADPQEDTEPEEASEEEN